MRILPPSTVTSKPGFSLPEVAISLGIAATALLTLVSLLPFGLNTLRDAGNKQTESRIIQSVINGYQTGEWASEENESGTHGNAEVLQDKILFFDQTGSELEKESDTSCNYVVRVLIGAAPSLNGDVSGNQYLRQLMVRITDRPANYKETLADDNKSTGRYRESNVWIAQLDQTGPLSESGL